MPRAPLGRAKGKENTLFQRICAAMTQRVECTTQKDQDLTERRERSLFRVSRPETGATSKES